MATKEASKAPFGETIAAARSCSRNSGPATVTILDESGVPTPVVHTRTRLPASRMGLADCVDGAAKSSPLYPKYGTRLDSQRARELLATRLERREPRTCDPPGERQKKAAEATGVSADAIGDFLKSSSGRALQREVVRGVFGMLKRAL